VLDAEAGSLAPDLAVLQLARPIPPSRVAENPRAAACQVFVDPADILDPLDARLMIPDLIAVGYGEEFVDPSATAIRRFRSVDSVHSTTEVPDPYLPDLPISVIFTITPLGILAAGDDGGPLFANGLRGLAIVGVAHGGAPVDPAFPVPMVDPGISAWIGVGNYAPNRDWVQSNFDLDGDTRIDTACGSLHRGINPIALTDPSSDPDGDGYITREDTCDDTYNPCQLTSDLDHDGVPDDCDAAPLDADITDHRGHSEPDGDGDGIPDRADCQPTVFNCPFAEDADGDLVLDACDNCPDVFNPDQADLDGDMRGDACDACPGVASMIDVDADHDTVDDACDNCLDLYNPLQENCNLDAEKAVPGAAVLGDLCDPTPCGETTLGNTTLDGTLPSGRPARIVRMNRVLVDGRSTRHQPARTGFRFCPCSGAEVDDLLTRNACQGDQFDGTGFCAISDSGRYDDTDERLAAPWRQMVMDYSVGTPTFDSEPREEARIDYRPPLEGTFRPDLAVEWNQEADGLRWDTIFGPEATPGPELPGVLWTHTPGRVRHIGGLPGRDVRVDFPDDLRSLTSHYWSGVVAAPTEAPIPFPCLHYVGPFLSNAGCPFCAPSFPAPFLALPGVFGSSCGAPFEPPVVAIPDLPFDLGPLLPVDSGLLERPDLRWLAPSEPMEWLPEGGTRLLALDSKLQTTVRLVETGQGLGLPSGGQTPPDCTILHTCEIVPPPQLQPAALGALALAASEPDDRVMVLSARREIFWTLEGVASSGEDREHTLAPQGRVVAHPLDPAQLYSAQRLPLGHVLAATYRAQDDALYVLDELTHGRGWRAHTEARLLRIDVSGTSAMQVVATWPRLSNNTRYALVAAPGDALWLAASAEPGVGASVHVVVRLEPADDDGRGDEDHDDAAPRWRVTAWAQGDGTLAEVQARADARGLSLVIARNGQEQAVG